MKRKLHRTTLALSTTAAVFTLLLLAGRPLAATPTSSLAQHAPTASALLPVAASLADDLVERRHLRHSRELLALPYFSFAQGLRRNRS